MTVIADIEAAKSSPNDGAAVDPSLPALPERTILRPGSYLARIKIARPCSPDALTSGLERMGWGEVYPDLSAVPRARPTAVSRRPPVRLIAKAQPTMPMLETSGVLFLGRLDKPIALRSTSHVSWSLAHRFESWDPYADIRRFSCHYFRLLPGVTYEIRFLARALPEISSREAITADLRTMRWGPPQLCALKKNMRIPGRPNADMTLWLGIARWEGPKAYITGEDPFYFEDVQAVGAAATAAGSDA